MSADTTPTSVTSGTSRPLATRLVPTRTSRRPAGERIEHALRGALALDDVAIEPADAQLREPLADLALDPLRAAAEVADPRRRAGRAAGGGRPGAAAVVAAQGGPGLVVDERPVAVRAGLDVSAVPAQDDRRRPAPVDHEDRPLAGLGVEGRQRGGERIREQPAVAGGELGTQVDGAHRGLGARRAGRAARRAGIGPPARGPCSRPTASRSRARRPRPRSRRGRWRRRAPGAAACGRSCRPASCSSSTMTRPTSASGATSAIRVPTTTSTSPARMRRHSSARSPSPSAEWSSATRTGRSARSRSTIGVASAISGTSRSAGPPGREAGGDRLDVDRGLAAARDAVEERGRRVARVRSPRARSRGQPPGPSVRPDPAGRAPRRPAGRPASGRRGRSRTSARSRPRRTSPAIADAPWRSASGAAGTPSAAARRRRRSGASAGPRARRAPPPGAVRAAARAGAPRRAAARPPPRRRA